MRKEINESPPVRRKYNQGMRNTEISNSKNTYTLITQYMLVFVCTRNTITYTSSVAMPPFPTMTIRLAFFTFS